VERISRYILRRLLVVIIGVLVILTVVFCLFRVLPDDPVQLAAPPWPSGVPPDDLSEQYADIIDMFEQPLYVQYFEFIGDMLTGDFGSSIIYRSDIGDYVYSAMWRTLILFGASLSLCLVIGSLAGRALSRVRSYYRRQALSIASLALFSLPVVAWQWLFLRYFSYEWGLLPASGFAPIGSSGVYLEYWIMPSASILLASIGAIILCVKDGQTRASAAMSPHPSTFRDGLFAALPNMQFMVAASLLFVVSAEWWFGYQGLGWYFMNSLVYMDYFSLQAAFFLLAIMVFTVNFAMETVVTLIRPRRRLNLCLREDDDRHSAASESCVRVNQLPFSFSRIGGVLIRLAKDYLRSPVGVVSLAVFIGIVALAVVGPWFSSDEAAPPDLGPWAGPSTDLFLDGATALVAISIPAGILAILAGMALGTAAGYSRPYADGIVMAVMQGLISIPFLGLVIYLWWATYRHDFGYLDAALACSVPIIALVTLLSFHGFVSARNRVAAASEGASRGAKLMYSLPATASWALSGLKYGMPLTVVTVFVCGFLRLAYISSWGYAFRIAVSYNIYEPIEWEYILLPLIGSALLVGSIFLILDTVERIIRTRFSELV